ncbi:MAG: hypothetical protein ACTSV3_05480 [Candidatus Thorarchaeota archaeon]|nr:MAG: hypothetical protein DRP09_06530 [Candidatus Thorarchaeota archaeon]RLI59780.1 MAG: hypothetical protein DRO87_01850 [Candidatus Thorarchaeota archaeon]
MGPTEMKFSKVLPTGHSVIIGLGEQTPDVAETVFDSVKHILHQEKFANTDWSFVSSDVMKAFVKELLEKGLVEALHDHGGFKDECPLGDQCPIHTTALENSTRRARVWDMVKGKYAAMRKRMSGGS